MVDQKPTSLVYFDEKQVPIISNQSVPNKGTMKLQGIIYTWQGN